MIILDRILESMLVKVKSNLNKEIALWMPMFSEVRLLKVKWLVLMEQDTNIDFVKLINE